MTDAKRPTSITVLAVVAFIFGILGVLGALSVLSAAAVPGSSGGNVGDLLLVYGVSLLVASALQLAFGSGALLLKPWAWTLGVALQVLAIALALLYVFLGASLGGQLLSIVPAALILLYLLTPAIRRAFGRG